MAVRLLGILSILLLPICTLWTAFASTAMAGNRLHKCIEADVTIRLGDDSSGQPTTDANLVCRSAANAIGYLDANGIPQHTTVIINVENLVSVDHYMSFGCYDSTIDEVFVISEHACIGAIDGKDFFGIANDTEIYRSFIAHEVAHAITSQNTRKRLSVSAQEYIAAVVQFETMSPDTRASILSRFKGEGYTSEEQINGILYAFNPAAFLVNAYKHFKSADGGFDFVHAILSGEVYLTDALLY